MKVLVLWENSFEKGLADNLVAVLRKVGAMLVYGKVNESGVLLEKNWQNKPKVTLECLAAESPSAPESAMPNRYLSPVFTRIQPEAGTLSVTRELMRDLVRMFPDVDKAKKTKPVVPKPNTTPTGVTVRKLDLWEDDDHADHTD